MSLKFGVGNFLKETIANPFIEIYFILICFYVNNLTSKKYFFYKLKLTYTLIKNKIL